MQHNLADELVAAQVCNITDHTPTLTSAESINTNSGNNKRNMASGMPEHVGTKYVELVIEAWLSILEAIWGGYIHE